MTLDTGYHKTLLIMILKDIFSDPEVEVHILDLKGVPQLSFSMA